ncbi:hypothetical protein ScPMuIL_002585 [Solemya velum]
MADRGKAMGMDRALQSKVASKYDPNSEAEVRGWFQELLGENIEPGPMNMEKALRDGILLIKLLQKVYDGTPNRPPACNNIKLKFTTMSAPFKQMENIEIFLKGAEAFGVQNTSLFQTVDLYEGRNMAMVLNTILQVGTECQRLDFQGSKIGPRPTESQHRDFSLEQLRQGHTQLTLQAGTNRFASQKGMTAIGAVRHISDIRADDLNQDSQGILTLQGGTNKYASQKGMTGFGAVRHISDIRADDMDQSGQSVLTLQAGTNRFASQKGMTGFGAVRHISDIRADDATKESQSYINIQAGSNQYASQKGMTGFGAQRHVADIRCDDMTQQGASVIGLQYGSNKYASQKGMRMGTQRHVSDIKCVDLAEEYMKERGLVPTPHHDEEAHEEEQEA